MLDERVHDAFSTRKGRTGSPGLTRDLRATGHPYNRKTVAKSMKHQDLRAKAATKFKATTDSNHSRPVAPNLLAQDITADAPNQKWVGDITYLWSEEGWLYLTVVIDLYSRLMVGWSLSARMTATLVCDALQIALWRRHMPIDLLVHTDRGSQYCSTAYQDLLEQHARVGA